MCFKKEDYKEWNYNDERIFKWILDRGEQMDVSELEYHGIHGICDRCEVGKGEDGKYYLFDEGNGLTDEEYEVSAYHSRSFEELIDDEEIPDLTEEEKERYIDLGYIIVYKCTICGQWGYDVWNN
ncbi:hypothetical protein [Bacillus cereus group sp. Bce015]|uniref:hypothetical protein n=1 Tax=Bacillus cereus group sp. Bce015 TaxID=3445249 RepID=UPI003F230756